MTEVIDPVAEVRQRRRGYGRWIAIGVGVVVIAFIIVLATRDSAGDRSSTQALDKPVPVVQGETLDGSVVDIDDFRGKWVVVNFVATWCVPCKIEHPELVAFDEQHRQAGDAVVLGVSFDSTDQERQALRRFFDEQGGDWPVVVGDTGRIAIDFGVGGVPETYVVDPTGIVRWKIEGGVTADQLNRVIGATGGGGS